MKGKCKRQNLLRTTEVLRDRSSAGLVLVFINAFPPGTLALPHTPPDKLQVKVFCARPTRILIYFD